MCDAIFWQKTEFEKKKPTKNIFENTVFLQEKQIFNKEKTHNFFFCGK